MEQSSPVMKNGDGINSNVCDDKIAPVKGLQSSGNVVENGRKDLSGECQKLYETCLSRFKNKGWSLRDGAKRVGVGHQTLLELEKAAKGEEFCLGEKALFKIRRFVLNGKKGKRKYRSMRPTAGLWAGDAV